MRHLTVTVSEEGPGRALALDEAHWLPTMCYWAPRRGVVGTRHLSPTLKRALQELTRECGPCVGGESQGHTGGVIRPDSRDQHVSSRYPAVGC